LLAIDTNVGNDICELEGAIQVKGNVGYYKGKLYAENCRLVFLFTDKKVQVLQAGSNSECGCGVNASLNHQFMKR
jgi:hypothetical protein